MGAVSSRVILSSLRSLPGCHPVTQHMASVGSLYPAPHEPSCPQRFLRESSLQSSSQA